MLPLQGVWKHSRRSVMSSGLRETHERQRTDGSPSRHPVTPKKHLRLQIVIPLRAKFSPPPDSRADRLKKHRASENAPIARERNPAKRIASARSSASASSRVIESIVLAARAGAATLALTGAPASPLERVAGAGRVGWIHPDCGFWMLRRSVADRKIAALAAGRDMYLGMR